MTQTRTPRLILRAPQATDLEVLFEIHHDPETNQFNPNGPMQTIADAEAYLSAWQFHWAQHGFGYWAVTIPDSHDVIGFGGVQHKDMDGEAVLNLYWRFSPAAWGKGYASEMARAALELAATRPEPVIANVRDTNLPSRQVAERAGLVATELITHEGVPSYVYRLPNT